MSHPEYLDVLLVDDDPNDQELTLRGLRLVDASLRIHTVPNGADALDYVLGEGAGRTPATTPRLMLLDLKMPRVNGLEVLERLRNRPDCKGLPIVMLTSSQDPGDVRRSYENGVNSYVVKPAEFAGYMTMVQQLARYWLQLNRTA